MADRNAPPPSDPDEMTWWEHREIAEGKAETAEELASRAHREPENAAQLLTQAQVQASLAVYHQLRAIGDHQALLARQQHTLAAQFDAHEKALADHGGSMADHGAALTRHTRAMGELGRAIAGHGEDVRDALGRWER